MAEWTQKEIEELLAEMTRKAMTDREFRQAVLEDANAALEKLAGRSLPEGINLKCIERDPNYQSTFVLPDLVDEEKMDDESLTQVAGGVSVFSIVSVCGTAFGVGPDILGCGSKACAADVSLFGVETKGGACYGQVCLPLATVAEECPARACLGRQRPHDV